MRAAPWLLRAANCASCHNDRVKSGGFTWAGVDLAKRFELTTLEDWDRVVAINQTGVFLGMRTVARAMFAVGKGCSIVNISSVAGA